MKKLTIVALIAAQLGAVAAPARAAEIVSSDPPRSHRTGAFIGARLHLPFDGRRHPPRAALAAAPTQHSVLPNGERRLRIGRGVEVGLDGPDVRLEIGGRPASRLVRGGDAPDGSRTNVSTVGWIAIGVGVVAATVFALYALCGSGEICSTDDD